MAPTKELPLVPNRRPFAAAAIAALTLTGVGATAGTAAAAPPAGSQLATYIVTLESGSVPANVAARAEHQFGGRTEHVYTAALKGFAVRLPEAQASRLSTLPGVVGVEADQTMMVAGTEYPTPSWGLDRIDQHPLAANSTYNYNSDGTGVTAYIIDTGMVFANTDFGARASSGVDEVEPNTPADDCNGHGTHVAGTVGGSQYGVAKNVQLVAVRVLDCNGSGSTAGVIAGVDWVTTQHKLPGSAPAVANMSLGGGVSSALDTAVTNSINSGVTYSIAAGNGNSFGIPQDACKASPARVSAALTVAASDSNDTATSWSNYGSCVDLFAPGLSITSDWYDKTNPANTMATNTISGTSMATPHVTGVAALYLQTHQSATPTGVSNAIKGAATPHIVKTSSRYKTANNNLLYSLIK